MQNKKLSFLGTALNRRSLKSITGGIIEVPQDGVAVCKDNKGNSGTVTCYGANCSAVTYEGCSCSSYTSGSAKSCAKSTDWD